MTTPFLQPSVPESPAPQLRPAKQINLLALACIIFSTTCGGAYGLEALIGAVGPGWAVLFILVTPLAWSLPTALMVAELTSLMPEEGGYYVWVRKAFGPAWAVQQACWTITTSIIWLAMYPVLFVSYLTFFLPNLAGPEHALARWLITLVMIASSMAVNLRGSSKVGTASQIGTFIVLGVFALMLVAWLVKVHTLAPSFAAIRGDFTGGHKVALLLGISYIVFNYSAWDSVSTYAGEVENPRRSYPLAITAALTIAVLSYLIPVVAGFSVTTDPAVWSSDAGWPVIARMIGGRWLGIVVGAAGMVSVWGLFNSQLLYASRLPYVLARDGWLPKFLAGISSDAVAPKAAIFTLCGLCALFTAFTFGGLAIIQCLLYAAALTLEFLSLLVMRMRYPDAPRMFRIPGGWFGLGYVLVMPLSFAVLVIVSAFGDWHAVPAQLTVVAIVAVAGVTLYFSRRKNGSL